jgi:hypothetical protein
MQPMPQPATPGHHHVCETRRRRTRPGRTRAAPSLVRALREPRGVILLATGKRLSQRLLAVAALNNEHTDGETPPLAMNWADRLTSSDGRSLVRSGGYDRMPLRNAALVAVGFIIAMTTKFHIPRSPASGLWIYFSLPPSAEVMVSNELWSIVPR